MDITNKPNRDKLKSYFVKNAIPTASNFAELVDGPINQRDDGVVKVTGQPLSVQADDGGDGTKKVLSFYKNLADQAPAWTVSLNPRTDPGNAATGRPGLGVIDASGASRLFIDETTGNLGVGTADPGAYKLTVQGTARFAAVSINTTDRRALLDIAQAARTDSHPSAVKGLYITGDFGADSDGVEFRHSNGTQGIGFGYNTIYATGANTPQDLNLKTRNGKVTVTGNLVVKGRTYTGAENPMRHRMYPGGAKVYQDIFEAKAAGAIKKLGNPSGYDEASYTKNNLWYHRTIIRFGDQNTQPNNGAELSVPADVDTAWVRVLGDRWASFKAYSLDNNEQIGTFGAGFRSTNLYTPDGALSDGCSPGGGSPPTALHQWVPIPGVRQGRLGLTPSCDFWLSGVAFSKNPWNHATNSAYAYVQKYNGGGSGVDYGGDGGQWNSDVLGRILAGQDNLLMVPVIANGRDKLLYIIEHNNNWCGVSHAGVRVNGVQIERFAASYDTPFARHWNSKYFERYIAAVVPASLVTGRFLAVKIDMTLTDQHIHFREIGTHDADTPVVL